ncbi:unnamed protein product (macronuclear) [Paramecium tetraurelia]|uniref:LNR domain-containing protein n=1 Tax=Paramecium tetraurelia TaxID=5888 RepID=A0EA76_PARTE|nr:uncharacterized protein GSPATT00024925001 [Paramecium tetraurelia]CAK92193.1 unnamed protein product [Paramecium tetraurelia]|eukprot:XP_001459590.1 hypothetical protein (macronuclear) [Paramecium tetraurelia strain d4-2]
MDGFHVKLLEQCDDGNNQNNDGCSDICQVESNWKCQQDNNISVCKYSIQPKFNLPSSQKKTKIIKNFDYTLVKNNESFYR